MLLHTLTFTEQKGPGMINTPLCNIQFKGIIKQIGKTLFLAQNTAGESLHFPVAAHTSMYCIQNSNLKASIGNTVYTTKTKQKSRMSESSGKAEKWLVASCLRLIDYSHSVNKTATKVF